MSTTSSKKLTLQPSIEIHGRRVGPGYPAYLVAEISANHHQEFEEAVRLLHAAKEAGADAVKLQTYTADTLTINSDRDCFRISGETPWDGRFLYDLYREAFTPWEWQPKLKVVAGQIGIELFSTVFDPSAVDFLEEMDVPIHKIASFELVDLPLIKKTARTGKPLILSTGMATLEEIKEAVETARQAGASQIALLKCTSVYPAAPGEMNLRTIPHLIERFNVPVGLSDHTLGTESAVAAVTLGACIVEKHFTLSRECPGPDSTFSLEPHEFKVLVESIRSVERALGKVQYGATPSETKSLVFRRSLFVIKDMKQGESFTLENLRSIRPGYGLAPKYLEDIIGRCASVDIKRGTPLSWDHVLSS